MSVPIVVQEPPLDGRRWNATAATLEPPESLAVAVSTTVCRRLGPGSVSLDVGAVVSDWTSFVEVAVDRLPALSPTL